MGRLSRTLAVIAPGMLVAATGVGAGDLATASFSGSQLGTAVLWAVVAGGVLKFALNEGLARWQLATGSTFLSGAAEHIGPVVAWLFLPYLVLWSFFVGAALMGACGVAVHAIWPVMADPSQGKWVWGLVASVVGLGLARSRSFRLFERAMGVLVGLMFITVVLTAAQVWPGTEAVLTGLVVPSIPDLSGSGLAWTIGLIGGVGGTVTILCYGYWIREVGRDGPEALSLCRVDLGAGYLMTVVFGLSMVIIGSTVSISGGGADLLIRLAGVLTDAAGPLAGWLFLLGAFCAVFSSLLGVWQAVPYIFADTWTRLRGTTSPDLRATPAYRRFQVSLALVPMVGLFVSFREAQLLYSVVGAAFLPFLAGALLYLNGKRTLVGELHNRWGSVIGLGITMLFFFWAALFSL